MEVQVVPFCHGEDGKTLARIVTFSSEGESLRLVGRNEYHLESIFDFQIPNEKLRFYVRRFQHPENWLRAFDLPKLHPQSSHFVAIALSSGEAAVIIEDNGFAGFAWGEVKLVLPVPEEEIATWSREQIQNWIDGQWADETSQLRRIVWWSDLSSEARDVFLNSALDGREELHRVMKWALAAHFGPREFDPYWDLEREQIAGNFSQTKWRNFELTPFLHSFRALLLARFNPLPKPTPGLVWPCHWYEAEEFDKIEVRAFRVTLEDQLEAKSKLEAWLRANFSQEQFQTVWNELDNVNLSIIPSQWYCD